MQGLSLSLAPPPPPRWWPAHATYAADFRAGRHMRGGQPIAPASAYALTRASDKLAPTRTGWQAFGPDTLARANGGALLEREETYAPINAALMGATPGALEAEGDLPSGWALTSGSFPAPVIAAVTTADGLAALVITFAGTNQSGSTTYPGVKLPIQPAAQGEVWTAACWFDAVFGSGDDGTVIRLQVQELNSGSYLGTTLTELVPGAGRQASTRSLSQPDANQAALILDHQLAPGATLDRTLTISGMTLTRSALLTSPLIAGDTMARVRAADSLVLHLPAGSHTLNLEDADGTVETTAAPDGGSTLVPVPAGGRTLARAWAVPD